MARNRFSSSWVGLLRFFGWRTGLGIPSGLISVLVTPSAGSRYSTRHWRGWVIFQRFLGWENFTTSRSPAGHPEMLTPEGAEPKPSGFRSWRRHGGGT